MNSSRLGSAALVVALAAGATSGCGTDGDSPSEARTTSAPQADASGARTRLGALEAASGDPVASGLRDARPSPGSIQRVAGPFDDRFEWRRLRLDQGTVSGAVRVTSDVSDLLELQVVAGFYDRDGRYLGLARFTHHLDEGAHAHEGPPTEVEPFTVSAPRRFRAEAASATVSVPVLVNE